MTETKRPFTEEERRIVSTFLDSMDEYFSDSDAEFQQEWQKFKGLQLADKTPEEIESLLEICKSDSSFGTEFGFLMKFDMWYNHSPIWPVPAGYIETREKEQGRS